MRYCPKCNNHNMTQTDKRVAHNDEDGVYNLKTFKCLSCGTYTDIRSKETIDLNTQWDVNDTSETVYVDPNLEDLCWWERLPKKGCDGEDLTKDK